MGVYISGPFARRDVLLDEDSDLLAKRALRNEVLMLANNPLLAFKEKHIRDDLYLKLHERPELAKKYPSAVKRTDAAGVVCLTPLRKNFGVNHMKNATMTVAILNPVDISKISDEYYRAAGKFVNPVVGMEIVADRLGVKAPLAKALKNEVTKLKSCKKAYLLALARESEVKTKREEKLAEFKKAVKAAAPKGKKMRLFAMVIYGTAGELEFFDGENWWERIKAEMFLGIAARRWTFGL
jgi:hypothetical protein